MDELQSNPLIEVGWASYEEYFGRQEQEVAAFRDHVMTTLERVYGDQPERFRQRLHEILELGMQVKNDLIKRYFRVACLAEGEDRELSPEEVLQIIGERPLKRGDKIYHFSAIKRAIGFEGHKRMYFSSSPNRRDVEADNLNKAEMKGLSIWRHTCVVQEPDSIIDHDAHALTAESRDSLIREYILGKLKEEARWYIVQKKGAIKVVLVEKVLEED